MAIRVIEVPLSVRFDPPPRPSLEDRREPTIPMKKRIGLLGMTEEERAELDRTKKWPMRQVEVPDGPPGFTLTSLPSQEYLRGFAAGYKAALRPSGPRHQIVRDITRILKLLEETDGNVEQARKRFIVEAGRTRLIDEPPRPRLTVRSTCKDLTFHQTGKRVIDLTPEKRSVISKRFTRAMKEIYLSG